MPGEITVVKAHGIKVAFVAFAPYHYDASLLDLPAARVLIKRAAREANIVVVYMHAGAEGPDADHVTGHEEYYLGEDRGNAEAFAHMAVDAGASLVIASGPHVLRGMQFYQRHLIAYSVGNFASYGDFSTEADLGMSVILHVTLSPACRFERARIYPTQFAGKGLARTRRRGHRLCRQAGRGGLRFERSAHPAIWRHHTALIGTSRDRTPNGSGARLT